METSRNLLSNISQCLINIEQYEEAIDYASQSIDIDPNFSKSILRKALAQAYCHQFDAIRGLKTL